MWLPRVRFTVRLLMVVIAESALVCAAILSARYWCLFAILPIIGAIRGASRSTRKLSAAVLGGAIWGGIPAGVYAVPLLIMALMGKGEAVFYALVTLEMSLVIGAGVGFLIGVGFWITEAEAI
jgi:type III secretory pathway component EscT